MKATIKALALRTQSFFGLYGSGSDLERERYFKYLNTMGSEMSFVEWQRITSVMIENGQYEELDLSIYPDGIRSIIIVGGAIDRIVINEVLPTLDTLRIAHAGVQDLVGVINLPVLKTLELTCNGLETIDSHPDVHKDLIVEIERNTKAFNMGTQLTIA